MQRLPVALLVFLLVLQASPAEDACVEGEVLVTFKQNLTTAAATAALGRHSLKIAEQYDGISRHHHRIATLVREKSLSTAQLIASLKADAAVETAEPNYIRRISAIAPNDTDFSKLWGLKNTGQSVNSTSGNIDVDTRFQEAWRLARSVGDGVVVGVVDTGADVSHPDLVANIWTNPNEIPRNAIDDDMNGYIDDIHGYDFVANTAAIADSGYHGTHVSGTIAAVGKNAAGVIGIDYRAKILPLKVSSDGTSITSSATISAYNYAIAQKQKGVNIIALNASFRGGSFSFSEQNAIAALRDAGIILCAAAGNEGNNNDSISSYPANYNLTNIISVAALTQNNGLASFSNYGATNVDIAAPGVNIYSTKPLSAVPQTIQLKVANTHFTAQEIQFSGMTPITGISGTVFSCGIGNPVEFPNDSSGYIALIQRGTLTFAQKITNATNAGAAAAVIYDNSLTGGSWTLNASGVWIPALQITQADGNAILAALPANGTVTNYRDATQAYGFLDGTSMATPHVAGACAFAAMNFPTESLSQRVSRILTHTTTVPALSGKVASGGRLDLLKIIDTDADGLPDWWETENFGNLAQIATVDSDGDGFSNLQEFLTGNLPQKTGSHLAFITSARGGELSKDFLLSFPSVEDTIYQVQWSNDLSTWLPLGSSITGNGSILQLTDPGALLAAPARFYRIGVPPQ